MVDTQPPTLTLLGDSPLTVECHGTFTDPGATASDACAGNLTSAIQASGSVDANTVGSYTRTYTVADGNGNSDTKTRTVNVVDTQAPAITLLGANPLTVECHGTFTDPGATASDACAGNLTSAIQATGSANANIVGSYTLSYTVSDGQGHSDTKTRTVNVVDTQAPAITLLGANPLTVECHGTFTDPGATASDACAGNLTSSIQTTGSVNVYALGDYTRMYTVSDGQGHSDTKTRTVRVVDTQAPTIACPANKTVAAAPGATTAVVIYTVTANDACGATVASSPLSGSAFPVGTTTVNATATDGAGLTASCSFTATVLSSPAVTVTAGSVQYSDIVNLTAAVSATPFPGHPLAGSVQFYINGSPVGSPVSPPSGGGNAVLPYTALRAPGSYNVTAAFTSGDPAAYINAASTPATLLVTQEDAGANYAGALFASLSDAIRSVRRAR